ncbi:thioredoxin family protein [Polaribacter sp.]|nr:thioredoxin family protein [Polaribacter sp.]
MKDIIVSSLKKSVSYSTYKEEVKNLLAEGKSTGNEQSEALTNYSLLNDRRMKRLDKTIKVLPEISNKVQLLKKHQTWLVLTESWCGDAAQNLPVINKIATLNENIHLRLISRDENDALMNLFLTNGGKSIPKLIALDADNNVIDTWGPRPTTATKMVADYKAEHGKLTPEFKQDLQVWYNKNKGVDTQKDLLSIIEKLQ